MKLNELLMRLSTIKAEHGGDIEVIVEGNYDANDDCGDSDVPSCFIQAGVEKVEAEHRCADEPAVFIVLNDIAIDD